MKVLVTGSSGFLGSHVCDELAQRGHLVVGFDRCPSPWRSSHESLHEFVEGDIRDVAAVSRAMGGCSAVYHCAAVADLDDAKTEPRTAVEVNVLGTLSVLESARSEGAHRILLASSVYVYSKGGSVYRTTKQAAESLMEDLAGHWGLDATILRFGSLYGPRADRNNAILRLTEQAVASGRIDFWGDGSEVREYIHIRDAAQLAVDALGDEFIGQSLHITGIERITTLELLDMIREILGGDLDIALRNEPFEGRYRLTPYAYREAVGRKMLGSTYVDLGVGLLEAIRHARENQEGNMRP